jgi:PAS domain S-box-containing protein
VSKETLTLITEILTVTFLIISILTIILPRGRSFLRNLWGMTLGKNHVEHLKVYHLLEDIQKELKNNGGESIKDILIRVEEKQISLDAFLHAQLNIHNVAIVRTDLDGLLTTVNRQYTRLTGYTPAEVKGTGWTNAIHPEDRERIKKVWTETVQSNRELSEDIRFMRPDGSCFSAHANAYREVDCTGKTRGWLATVIPHNAMDCPFRSDCVMRGTDCCYLSPGEN